MPLKDSDLDSEVLSAFVNCMITKPYLDITVCFHALNHMTIPLTRSYVLVKPRIKLG